MLVGRVSVGVLRLLRLFSSCVIVIALFCILCCAVFVEHVFFVAAVWRFNHLLVFVLCVVCSLVVIRFCLEFLRVLGYRLDVVLCDALLFC